MTISIRRGRPDEVDTVLKLRRAAREWLMHKDTDQWEVDWPSTEEMVAGFQRDLETGSTWFAEDMGHSIGRSGVIGCITVNTRTDEGLWGEAERESALFVHRMMRNPHSLRAYIGTILLNHASDLARCARKGWVRLDAWTTNTDLHQYYLNSGFAKVRTMENHPTPSAACFERKSSYRVMVPYEIHVQGATSTAPAVPKVGPVAIRDRIGQNQP